ncbi:MAG: NAD-dependent epimerase/dehydratase family protein [Thermoplasmataceae archaeon]
MKVLVTGHRGFIGSVVYSLLRSRGLDVYGVDIGDGVDSGRYDYIVHLAARTLIRKSIELPFQYYEDNLHLSMQFIERCRNQGSTIIFPTSGSVSEASNPYSLSKRQTVEWINLYRKLYGINAYVLKFYNVYGPNSRKGAVYLFLKSAIKNEPVTIFGDGSHTRDFIHVQDVATAILKIIEGEFKPGDYEMGTGKGTTVNQLLRLVEEVSGKKLQVIRKGYIVDEADSLVASNPMLRETKPLKIGISEIYEELSHLDPNLLP